MNDDQKWLDKLTPEEYRVCREKGTEPPFSGEYNHNPQSGKYLCKCCGEALFDSGDKFDSGSGWPSFDRPASDQVIRYLEDGSHGMRRVEAMCDRCGCHLGHVFDDGPSESTGKRYCINSLSLDFEAGDDE
ncbi:MAG: peptide-methionine (R)-S-oxide reductase MsrB [Gammaproteobacteria bacterium]|nr:peptide-methionine (R)-S-oxide reductase MsrB [Gammaproteobacteria bacterium]